MGYATDHAGVLADVRAAGSAVTFTLTTPGPINRTTGVRAASTTTTVAGYAIQTRGDPQKYMALQLVQSESPTLLFVPNTYGSLPAPGYTLSWNSITYTVRDVEPIAPDGTAIMARTVVTR